MDQHGTPTRAVRSLLAALLVLLGFLAAPASTGPSEAAFPVVHVATTSVPSHHGATDAGKCHAAASCTAGLVPNAVALGRTSAGDGEARRFSPWLDLSSHPMAPDPPPPRA